MSENYNRTPNCICEYCGKPFYIRPHRMKTQKHKCCSLYCNRMVRKVWMSGEGNHQYGLKGPLNASFNGKTTKIKNGYRFIRKIGHPFAEPDGFIREHRLVAEKYLLNSHNSVIIDGKRYLSPEYEVHHKDGDKLNNDPKNLLIVTPSEHRTIHNKLRHYKKKTQ